MFAGYSCNAGFAGSGTAYLFGCNNPGIFDGASVCAECFCNVGFAGLIVVMMTSRQLMLVDSLSVNRNRLGDWSDSESFTVCTSTWTGAVCPASFNGGQGVLWMFLQG
eukprot:TRINITY_DN23652_c0_g1_i1.p1 TRINITY_DN23652_c0_g1~~TRINITY_DN23652_c0_g1_i1.p1  ORF type:complete len:108 (+),score=16.32 TRINITY_DN23652_c0_g1_i1:242-565(+)